MHGLTEGIFKFSAAENSWNSKLGLYIAQLPFEMYLQYAPLDIYICIQMAANQS